jgi:hypothetical protein
MNFREATWDDFVWPEWVPEKTRQEIIQFWGPYCKRTMLEWVDNAKNNRCPLFSTDITVHHVKAGIDVAFEDEHFEFINATHYVFAWNNIARIVHDDGRIEVVSTFPYSDRIDWSGVQPASFEDLKQYVPGISIEKGYNGAYKGYVYCGSRSAIQ